MAGQQKMSSELEAAEMDQLAEVEMIKLQKQYRGIENERSTFIDSKEKQYRKFNKILQILEKEKLELQFQLQAQQFGVHSKMENKYESRLKNLLKKKDKIQGSLKKKKNSLWELEHHIKKIQREITKVQNCEITENYYNESIYGGQRTVKKLENRLDVVNKRAGSVMTENTALRSVIDHMLLERATFNTMWEKLVQRLHERKKYMMDLIEQSTTAYDQREELCKKLQVLKDKTDNEKMMHVQEMRDLQRMLDHDAKLLQFLGIKGHKRSSADMDAREVDKHRKEQEEYERQIEEYDLILTRILSFTNEDSVDMLMASYQKKEDENFALFNYVNELTNEVEALTETVQNIQDNIDIQEEINDQNEKSKDDNVEVLAENMELQTGYAEQADQILEEYMYKLAELLNALEKLYLLLHCDTAPILNLLGKKCVNLNNAQLFLGIIERKITQIIKNVNYMEPSNKLLGKKDRVPTFNVKESVKPKN